MIHIFRLSYCISLLFSLLFLFAVYIVRPIAIVGKAKNLKCRLSTYNKTCDHQVVYYKECKSEEYMNTTETLVYLN